MSFKRIAEFAKLCDIAGDKDHIKVANAIDIALEESTLNNKDLSYVVSRLSEFANCFDNGKEYRSANIIDNFINKFAAELWDSANDRDSKYNFKDHNEKSLYTKLKEKVDIDFPKHESVLETMHGSAPSLLTRHSPDYPGVPLLRVSDGVYQDVMTRKVYDFNKGFVSDTGKVYPGGSTAHQTPTSDQYLSFQQVLESRTLKTRPR